jgi:hypothetical protein
MHYIATDELLGVSALTAVDAVQRLQAGMIVHAIDADGGMGGAEFIYLPGGAGITPGVLVGFDPVNKVTTPLPSVGNSAQSVAVSLNTVPAGNWSWFLVYGAANVNKDGTALAAGAQVGIGTAAGTVGASTAGKQLLAARALNAAAAGATQALVSFNRSFAEGQIT